MEELGSEPNSAGFPTSDQRKGRPTLTVAGDTVLDPASEELEAGTSDAILSSTSGSATWFSLSRGQIVQIST